MIPWTITWGARSWTSDDLTAADLLGIQILTNGSWENCDPWAGPAQLVAMIAVLEARTSGRPMGEVLAEIHGSPAGELVDAITERVLAEVD